MTATATIREPVCEEPNCGTPIPEGTFFYFVPDKNGGGQVICADCRGKMMAFLENEFSKYRQERDDEEKNIHAHQSEFHKHLKARDEAEKKLHECTAALSRVTCAKKEIA